MSANKESHSHCISGASVYCAGSSRGEPIHNDHRWMAGADEGTAGCPRRCLEFRRNVIICPRSSIPFCWQNVFIFAGFYRPCGCLDPLEVAVRVAEYTDTSHCCGIDEHRGTHIHIYTLHSSRVGALGFLFSLRI